jgi:hypothetical protein
MKPTPIKIIIPIILLLISRQAGFSQGFVNLDFESANLSGYSPGSSVPTNNAIPGWVAYNNNRVTLLPDVNYVNTPSSSGGVEIITNNPIQGDYYIYLGGGEIGQTGTIPIDAESLIFWGNYSAVGFGGAFDRISFGGQTLTVVELGETTNYNIYGIDVSAFAGDTAQLLFSAISGLGSPPPFAIDNIQFSSSPTSEPSASWLLLLGSGIFIYVRTRTHRAKTN